MVGFVVRDGGGSLVKDAISSAKPPSKYTEIIVYRFTPMLIRMLLQRATQKDAVEDVEMKNTNL